jgi:uncharacterized protein YbjQ (UPF0145 family)
MAECGNCGEALKSGFISENWELAPAKIAAINLAGNHLETACNKCGDSLWSEAKVSLEGERFRLQQALPDALSNVPIASIHSPARWEYDVLSVVTAQSVTGTGLFSDVTSAFTDLFGTQSGSYNAKLREGENLCKTAMRVQALSLDGNAIVAADVDYAEVGGQRAMLMVCMTGTAIRLTNAEQVAPALINGTAVPAEMVQRLQAIEAGLRAV